MKKKLIPLIMALVCSTACVFSLAACGGESGPKLDSLRIAKTGEQPDDPHNVTTEITYGETPDLSVYKLYLYYSNGDTEDIATNNDKITVKYSYLKKYGLADDRTEIENLPTEWVTGSYTIEYTYDGKTDYNYKAKVIIAVVPAKSGAFRVYPTKTTWYEDENASQVTLRNPNGLAVENVHNIYDANAKNDTNGIFSLCYMQKAKYDSLTEEQKTDFEYLDSLNDDVHSYFSDGQLEAGEYMLFAMVNDTYNYEDIVTSAVKLTVKDSIIERTFTFQDIVLKDSAGNTVTDDTIEFVATTENLKTANVGKTAICKANGEVRGTVDFGNGTFDSLTSEEVYHYIKHNPTEVVIVAQQGGVQIAECVLNGNTLTMTMEIPETTYKWIVTYTG